MFNILAVSGSPRKEGNTELLLAAALEPFRREGHTVHKFFFSEKTVAPCTACDACAESGICVIEDDFQELMEKFDRCDAVIMGSPTYSRNISGQLLSAFNRFHCISHKKSSRDSMMLGGAIAVAGSPNASGITLNIMYNWLLSRGVCCIPAVMNGVTVVARAKGEVKNQPKGLSECRVLGENILRMLNKTKGAA